MKTFTEFLQEAEFYLGRTKYTCYFGRYSKIRNSVKELITPFEYYEARKKYNRLKRTRGVSFTHNRNRFREKIQVYNAINSNPNLYKGREGKICTVFTQNYFTTFVYSKDGNHRILNQLFIESNRQQINIIRGVLNEE